MSKLEEEKDNVEKLAAGLRDENAQLRKENLRLLTLETKWVYFKEKNFQLFCVICLIG